MRWVAIFCKWLAGSGAILLAVGWALLQLPPVQQRLVDRFLEHLYVKTAYRIRCDSVRLRGLTWSIRGLSIQDPQAQPLCTVAACGGSLRLWPMLFCPSDAIGSIALSGAQLYVAQTEPHRSNVEAFYAHVLVPLQSNENVAFSIPELRLDGVDLYCRRAAAKEALCVQKIGLQLSHLRFDGTACRGRLVHFSYQHASAWPFVVTDARTHFRATASHVQLDGFQCTTHKSRIRGNVRVRQAANLPLFSEMQRLEVEATLQGTQIALADLAPFWPEFSGVETRYALEGKVAWTPQKLSWHDCLLTIDPTGGYLRTSGSWPWASADAPASVSIAHGLLHKSEMEPYLSPKVGEQPAVQALTYVRLQDLSLVGNATKADFKGTVRSNLGNGRAELALDLSQGLQKASYSGKMAFQALAMHRLLPAGPIAQLSIDLAVRGAGFGSPGDTAEVSAHIAELRTALGAYKDMDLRAAFAQGRLTFSCASKDPSLLLSLAGSCQMDRPADLQVHGVLERCLLEKMVPLKRPLHLRTRFALAVDDLKDPMPSGSLTLHRLHLQSVDRKTAAKCVALRVHKQGRDALVTLASPWLDAQAKGAFTWKTLLQHIDRWSRTSDSSPPAALVGRMPEFAVDYAIQYKEGAALLPWICAEPLELAPQTAATGSLSYKTDYAFSLHIPHATFFRFRETTWENNALHLTAEAFNNVRKRSLRLTLHTGRQKWFGQFQMEQLSLQAQIDRDAFSLSLLDPTPSEQGKGIALAFSGKFLPQNAVQICLAPSEWLLGGEVWKVHATSPTWIRKGILEVGTLCASSGESSLILGGTLSDAPTPNPLRCRIRNLGLRYAFQAVEATLRGRLHANLVLRRQKGRLVAGGELGLEQCFLQEAHIGNVHATLACHATENHIALTGHLEKEGQISMQANGRYFLDRDPDSLALSVAFRQLDLEGLNPLTAPVFAQVHGKLNGNLSLTGTLTQPRFHGAATIEQGQFQIAYLNASYRASGQLKIHNRTVTVERLHVHDSEQGSARLTGEIALQKDFPLSLAGRVENLHVLNTTAVDNPDFFGSLYASGTLSLTGPALNLLFKARATTHKGNLTILSQSGHALEDPTTLVQFVHKQTGRVGSGAEAARASRSEAEAAFRALLELQILPSVTTQVVFGTYDSKDRIQGKGTGVIQLEVGTKQKPYLMGNYVFQEGICTVSVYSLVEKKFSIVPNSQVVFNGYPQEGLAYIQGVYTQMASTTDLLPTSTDKRPIPVEISFNANGRLDRLHATYAISFPVQSTDFELNGLLEACVAKSLMDKNHLSKQILSVLVARRIYNDREIDGWDAIKNSVSDLISQRIQHLVSKLDRDLEIDTNLAINRYKQSTLDVLKHTKIKVGYRLWSGRLKIAGALGDNSTVINDWEIACLLPRVENLYVKTYCQPLTESDPSKRTLFGVGLSYTRSIA